MEIIQQYISALFAKLPATLETLHLKDAVAADAISMYNRLVEEGMDRNTAIGTVLSSVGSLSDILARHGMEYPVPESRSHTFVSEPEMLSDEVEDYLDAQYSIARMNAFATGLCILSPFAMMADEMKGFLGHWIGDGIGAIGFFGSIAFAVMLFIYAGGMQKNWRGFAQTVHLTAGMCEELRRRVADYRAQRTEYIALGVGLCIFSPAPTILFDDSFGAFLLFACVAVGVYLLILADARAKACRRLLKNG